MRADQLRHQPHCMGLILPLMLFEARRQGMLPGVN